MKILAEFISYILNPLVVFLLSPFVLVYSVSKDFIFAFEWTILSSVFLLVTALFVVYEVHVGNFSDFDVSKRTQRPRFYTATGILILLYFITVILFHDPEVLLIGVFGTALGIMLYTIVNNYIKVSTHIGVLTAFTLIMGVLFGKIFFLTMLLIPLMAWSRLRLKRHTLQEEVTGFILAVLVFLLVYLLRTIMF